MYVCKAYLWNKESLMVYNLERKQKELKCLHEYFCDSISMSHQSPQARSAIDLGQNNYSNDKSPRQVILEFVPN